MSLEHGELLAGYFKPDALDSAQLAKLDSNALWAWIILCLQANPRCGIFEPNLQLWSMRSRVPVDDLPRCLNLYEERGWIERDNDYIWLVNYTKIQGKQQQWLDAARREVLEMQSCTTLAARWLEYYSDIKPISNRYQFTEQDSTGQKQNSTEQVRAAAAPQTLIQLESTLTPDALSAWLEMKQEMQRHRKSQMREDTPRKLLAEWLISAQRYGFDGEQIAYAIRQCSRAATPAENERYFRKCALSYVPDPVAEERYYTGPAKPAEPTPHAMRWKVGEDVFVCGVYAGTFNGSEVVHDGRE